MKPVYIAFWVAMLALASCRAHRNRGNDAGQSEQGTGGHASRRLPQETGSTNTIEAVYFAVPATESFRWLMPRMPRRMTKIFLRATCFRD